MGFLRYVFLCFFLGWVFCENTGVVRPPWVSSRDLAILMQALGPGPSEDRLQLVLQEMDPGEHGIFYFEEFLEVTAEKRGADGGGGDPTGVPGV